MLSASKKLHQKLDIRGWKKDPELGFVRYKNPPRGRSVSSAPHLFFHPANFIGISTARLKTDFASAYCSDFYVLR
jgi:hypothetical protein